MQRPTTPQGLRQPPAPVEYAVAVERRYRGLPPLPDVPVPYTLTAKAGALLAADTGQADLVPLPRGQEVTA